MISSKSTKSKNIGLFLIGSYLLILIFSLIAKINFLNVYNAIIFLGIITFILILNEKLLLFSTILISIFYKGISEIFWVFQYAPIYFYILMLSVLFIKVRKVKIYKVITIISLISIVWGLIPLINESSNIVNLIFSLLKRYAFLIILLFTYNLKVKSNKFYIKVDEIFIGSLLINIPIMILQFIKGINGDNIGGFLGSNMTGIIIYLFSYYIAILIGYHYKGKISSYKLLLYCLIPIIYSALCEVKIGFIIIPLILLLYFLLVYKGFKAILLTITIAIFLGFSYSIFIKLYPTHDFVNKEFLNEYLFEMEYGYGTVNRLSFKNDVDKNMFNNNIDTYIGKGIGSGNPSKTSLLRGYLNEKYDYLKYYWFTLPYLYVEGGIIGIIMYVLIYVIALIKSWRLHKVRKNEYTLALLLMSITNFIFIIYNDGLLNYTIITIYWIYFGLELGKDFNKKIP